MHELVKNIDNLLKELGQALVDADISTKSKKLGEVSKELEDPNVWQDNLRAQELSKTQAKLQSMVEPWLDVETKLKDIKELADTGDESLQDELQKQLQGLSEQFGKLKKQLRYSGEYDHYDAIVSIYAGAGGTDAQDWAEMLERMYLRWMEKAGFKTKIIDRSTGDEAGIKSVTVEVDGSLAYGKLKGEHGVHRLVRLSPFNADHLRQTSFAKVEVLPKIDSPEDVDIDDKDLKIDVYRAGGHGGQSVNTTDSAVRITHLPTGVTVSIQNERSQVQNKEVAMTILRSRLIHLKIEQHLERLADIKGANQSAEWGNQIRNYVLHPYKLVKDLRSGLESGSVESVLDGDIDAFIESL